MQPSYIVIVGTDDGKLLVKKKISGKSSSTLSIMARLFGLLSQAGEDLLEQETEPISGTTPSVPDSSQCTDS